MNIERSDIDTNETLNDPPATDQNVNMNFPSDDLSLIDDFPLTHSDSAMSLRRWVLEEQNQSSDFLHLLPNCASIDHTNMISSNGMPGNSSLTLSSTSTRPTSQSDFSIAQSHWLYGSEKKHSDLIARKPWSSDPNYFKNVHISALATLKMVVHCNQGGNIEVMGMLIGKVDLNSFIVMDAVPLPVEGTETRVNAQAEAYEFMAQHMQYVSDLKRTEQMIGWYHSHPGYGCWLSGIDVETQSMHQSYEDPFLAIVIDPIRTISLGKINLGAFRTFPDNYLSTSSQQGGGLKTTDPKLKSGLSNGCPAPTHGSFSRESQNHSLMDYQVIPSEKIADFGMYCNHYYSLEVSYFKTEMDSKIISILWNKYWAQTLSSSGILGKSDYDKKASKDLLGKLEASEKGLNRFQYINSTQTYDALTNSARDSRKLSLEKTRGLMGQIFKSILFKNAP